MAVPTALARALEQDAIDLVKAGRAASTPALKLEAYHAAMLALDIAKRIGEVSNHPMRFIPLETANG